jgi:hypothetical protein
MNTPINVWPMNEDTGLKILAVPGAVLTLIGIGYAYGLAVSGCPKPTIQARIYAIDLTLVAAGILLASGTAIAGYQTGLKSSTATIKEYKKDGK